MQLIKDLRQQSGAPISDVKVKGPALTDYLQVAVVLASLLYGQLARLVVNTHTCNM